MTQQEKNEEKVTKPKAPKEVKPKLSLDFKDNHDLFKMLNNTLEDINKKEFGRKATAVDLLEVLLPKLDEETLTEVKNLTYSKMDKVKLAHLEFMEKSGETISFEDFLIGQLKLQ